MKLLKYSLVFLFGAIIGVVLFNYTGMHGFFWHHMKGPMHSMHNYYRETKDKSQSMTDQMNNPFDSWFKKKIGGGTVEDISKREDSDNIYYDITVHDLKATSLTTKVEEGYITITGKLEKKNGSNVFSSSFNRTFPLPNNVDADKMKVEQGNGKITLVFPKTKV